MSAQKEKALQLAKSVPGWTKIAGRHSITDGQLEKLVDLVRSEVLDEAIKVCEDQDEPRWVGYENPFSFGDGREACIRALKSSKNAGAANE